MIDVELDAGVPFLDLLDARDRLGALAFAHALLEDGWSPNDVITGVLAPVQRRVGELWAAGEWSISQEHASTAIVDEVLGSLSSARRGARGRLVLACAEEEWHGLPARMIAEQLRDRDWDVTYLGASADAGSLGEFLRAERPVALLLSCSVPMSFMGASRMVDAAHAAGYRVLAGGAAFPGPRRASALGADGWAATLADADELLEQWRHDGGAPTTVSARGKVGAAALLAAQTELVDSAVQALQGRLPVMAGFSERQLTRTRADYRCIIAFAAAAVLVQDHLLFGEFLDWLDAVLVKAGVPDVLDVSLAALSSVAADHPELQAVLASGRAHLA